MGKAVLDTNVLLDSPDILDELDGIILCSSVLEELDKLKTSQNSELGMKAREANRRIERNKKKIQFVLKDIYDDMPSGWDRDKRDNKIVLCAVENNANIISNDINVRIKAESVGVHSRGWYKDKVEEYKGYKEVFMTHEEQADFYAKEEEYDFDLLLNQYIVLKDKDTGQVIDRMKMTENGLRPLEFKQINSKHMGKIKPRNLEQMFLFDMLQNKNLTILCCKGKFGVGKDYVMIAHALDMIENGRYDKLVWVRNNIEVAGSNPVGFLPGSLDEKLTPYALNLADHLGGKMGMEQLMRDEKIELQHLGFLRGRDLKNSIVYVTESQNLTKDHIQLLIGRIGEGSVLFLNGDYKQVDNKMFSRDSGLNVLIDKLKGHENFGFVQLEKTERSKTAAMADLLD